jgi:hypothetical protein
VFVSELDDVAGGDRPDPVDRFQLLDGRASEADRALFGSQARDAPDGASLGPAGDEYLLPVGEAGREVDRFERRVAGGAPARSTALVTLAPAGSL